MQNKILIREIFDTDFEPNYQMGNLSSFRVRRACRGVLVNEDRIALLNVTRYNFHKLPGGGIKKGESVEEAFKRELLEEVGCDCEILDQSGIIIEWRDQLKLLQISYVFLAKVVGEVGQNKLEQGEIDDGFKLEWIPFDKIEEVLKNDNPTNYEGKFITIRDKSIVEFYRDRLHKIFVNGNRH